MLFFLLLLAFLTIGVGLGRAACASRVVRAAGRMGLAEIRWRREGTGKVLASDLKRAALRALRPEFDRCCAPMVALAWRSHSGPPSAEGDSPAICQEETVRTVAAQEKTPFWRSNAGWSSTKLFMSGLQQTACTYRFMVAPTATGDVPLLWR